MPPNRRLIKQMTELAAEAAGLELEPEQGVVISFVEDHEMARINYDCLEHEGTTDVITFAYLEDELLPDDTAVELIICVDFAWREGKKRQKSSFARELALYIVHGLLHSAGEDDLSPGPRRRMRRREREVMAELAASMDFDAIFPGIKTEPS